MSEQQPELRWAPIPPRPKRRGRIWLILGLAVLAVAIAVTLLVLFLPRGGAPDPEATPTTSTAPSPSTTPGSPDPTPSQTPQITPPPVVEPELDEFVAFARPRLDDAATGLGFLPGMSGPDAVQIVDQLQQDAERLGGTIPPSAITEEWSDALADYTAKLVALRTAADEGSSMTAAIEAASNALQQLRAVIGL